MGFSEIADEKMLRTVIRNLVSNAIKFTPKGGTINIKAIKTEDAVQVSVSDTGVGMEQETVDKLFKIETSFTSRGTENEKGTGLGLLLCKEFLEKHGGNIWIESEIGKGSTFTFSIPR
jgi:signal transduction histidine kinase